MGLDNTPLIRPIDRRTLPGRDGPGSSLSGACPAWTRLLLDLPPSRGSQPRSGPGSPANLSVRATIRGRQVSACTFAHVYTLGRVAADDGLAVGEGGGQEAVGPVLGMAARVEKDHRHLHVAGLKPDELVDEPA
jgi:hypothetical protein